MNIVPVLQDLVLIGGGHAHVHVLKMMGMKKLDGLRITLISRDIESPYSGMIPGYVAGYYSREECHIDLLKLCSFARVVMINAEVIGLNVEKQEVYCSDGRPPITYDILSINVGISPSPLPSPLFSDRLVPRPPTSPTIKMNSITPVKPIDGFCIRWDNILKRVKNIARCGDASNYAVAVVGGGAGGVELCFAMHHRIMAELRKQANELNLSDGSFSVKLYLINRGNDILSSHCQAVRNIVCRLLREKDIDVHLGAEICHVEHFKESEDVNAMESRICLISTAGSRFYCDDVIWCTEAKGQVGNWLRETSSVKLACDEGGFVMVKPTLQSISIPNIFAAGDICNNLTYPRPKAGVFAVRAGPPLYENICRYLLKQELQEWIPQVDFLGIIGCGDEFAVASKGGMGVEGKHLWKLKDTIDRKWMAGYQGFPTMEEMTARQIQQQSSGASATLAPSIADSMGAETIAMLSKVKMRCGGCGSKVGQQTLTRALARVHQYAGPPRPEVISGGDDAAVIRPPVSPSCLVQTIDYFRSFVGDPFLFGQIAANHALSDVFAMNGEAVSALALCVLPYGPEEKVEQTLVHMLAGALKVLRNENCSLVGGHTAEGAEAALGMAVTGVVHPTAVFRKGPLTSGRVIVLTKALGTGTIMAADMRYAAKGAWVAACWQSMIQSNAAAARILSDFHCSACTDVTGFGLMGHLLEMIQFKTTCVDSDTNSSCGGNIVVNLKLDSIPLLRGAADCVGKGILSSLQPQNIRCARAVRNIHLGEGHPAYPLLFDPQTSGGLLAEISANEAAACIAQLREAGYEQAAVIGSVSAGTFQDTESTSSLYFVMLGL